MEKEPPTRARIVAERIYSRRGPHDTLCVADSRETVVGGRYIQDRIREVSDDIFQRLARAGVFWRSRAFFDGASAL